MDRQQKQSLLYISPRRIRRNPDNPRLIFRQEEMETLLLSIDRHGIQVPIVVYKDGPGAYVLIDGERRWRCAEKLNLDEVPALVQERPTALENLLLMYNIHALREQWDYFTIASNLRKIIELFEKERNKTPNEVELSEATGLTRGQIRRCNLILNLPKSYQEMLHKELELPKAQQKLTEDFFIEMEKSLKTVVKRLPEFEGRIDEIRNTLIRKFRSNKIGAVTEFRNLSKIATAVDNLGVKRGRAEAALNKIFDRKSDIGIKDVFEQSFEFKYDEHRALSHATYLLEFLEEFEGVEKRKLRLDAELRKRLADLMETLRELLGDA